MIDRERFQQMVLCLLDRKQMSRWFFTSSADEVYYYFLALLNTEKNELTATYAEYVELVKWQSTNRCS